VMRWSADGVTAAWPVIVPYYDTHEMGGGSVVRNAAGDAWVYAGARSTKTSWRVRDATGVGDRLRGFVALYPDLMGMPSAAFWDSVPRWDLACQPRNTCGDASVIGPFMPALVWIDGELLLFIHDPDGMAVWKITQLDAHVVTLERVALLHSDFPWSELAAGDDGALYALVGSHWFGGFWDSDSIEEVVSNDRGVTWTRTGRSWRVPSGEAVADACYVRDEWGHIRRSALVLVALVLPSQDPTSNTWYLHWWADAGAELPKTWGHEPGWHSRRARRHLQ